MIKIVANKTGADAATRVANTLGALNALTNTYKMLRGYVVASSFDESPEETFVKLIRSTTDYNGYNLTEVTCAISHAAESNSSTQTNAAYMHLQSVVVDTYNLNQGMNLLYFLNSLVGQHTDNNEYVFSPALGHFTGVTIALRLGENKAMPKSDLVDILWMASVTSSQHFNSSVNAMMTTVDGLIKIHGLGSLAPEPEVEQPQQKEQSRASQLEELLGEMKAVATLAVVVETNSNAILHAWCCMHSRGQLVLSETITEIVGIEYDEPAIVEHLNKGMASHPFVKLIGLEINVKPTYI